MMYFNEDFLTDIFLVLFVLNQPIDYKEYKLFILVNQYFKGSQIILKYPVYNFVLIKHITVVKVYTFAVAE